MQGESKTRFVVHFSGVVQGVGFRYTTLQVSRHFEVVGSIENLADGRVRMIAEGLTSQIELLIAKIVAETSGRVTDIDRTQAEPTGGFSSFQIV